MQIIPHAFPARATLLIGALFVLVLGAFALIGPEARHVPGPEEDGPHVVFVVGEQEYYTAETLRAFARDELAPRGFRTTFVDADPQDGNAFPGLDVLREADLLVLSVRRRTPPARQMALIRAYLEAGKPLVAIRTASHAFALRRGSPPEGHVQWPDFDRDVLGAQYEGHYSNREGTEVAVTLRAGRHPILRGITEPAFHSGGTLYRSRALAPTTEVLLTGRTTEEGETVTEPVAWTNTYRGGRVFYTSLGHPDDFEQQPFRRMLTNAVYWTLGQDVPRDMRIAGNAAVAEYIRTRPGRGDVGDASLPLPPQEALEALNVADDLQIELVASEPTIHQPLKLHFDHRGRLWIVQYLQYPYPEGVRITHYDQHMRAEFDTVPDPPPEGARGADRITVLSDTDGDGTYDAAEDVITGLNITTSVVLGRGGIWVLSPPYLLFYPDPDGDGRPDGPPEVHLSGFGLQDTHAVANGLAWGPDGWLYGAQGSTTESTVRSAATQGMPFKGQAIWRYHPETAVFELFAEGGGNTWNVEFDRKGRLFTGTNAGLRGLHYKQGAYYTKNWGKHGPLTNPYAFGSFPHMKHTGDTDRFTHTIQIYEGGSLPERYAGRLIGVNALQNRIQTAELQPLGSTFETVEANRIIETQDRWFRPVDIEAGPDGALYVADWYDTRLTHVDPSDNWHRASGRVYRISGAGTRPLESFDLSRMTTDELIDLLSHPNKWHRQEALRLIGDRKDRSAVPRLARLVRENTGQLALEALWALHLSGGFDEASMRAGLRHADPHVRRWTVRLIGDRRSAPSGVAPLLAGLARTEPDVEVRSQLASSAKRLPGEAALPVIRALLGRSEDTGDPHIPLQLWWALEAHAESSRAGVLDLFEEPPFWKLPLVEHVLIERLMQRFVAAGGEANLNAAARLLERAPGEAHTQRLISGLQEGLRGRELTDVPPALEQALDAYQQRVGRTDVALGLRQGRRDALEKALDAIADPNADKVRRLEYIQLLGEVHRPEAVPALLQVLGATSSPALRRAALEALMRYDDPAIGRQVVRLYPGELRADPDVRAAAQDLLASRRSWTMDLLTAVDRRLIEADDMPRQVVQQMALHDDPEVGRLIERHWPDVRPRTPAQLQQRTEAIAQILRAGAGDPAAGRPVFMAVCGACHTLHGEGGTIGPDLTGYDRDNVHDMLLNTVDPNAAIREGYVNYVVETKDGRTLTGIIDDQSGGTVTLRSLSGQTTTVPESRIERMQALKTSIMPEDLLDPLSDEEVRNLFEYLRSEEPPQAGTGRNGNR